MSEPRMQRLEEKIDSLMMNQSDTGKVVAVLVERVENLVRSLDSSTGDLQESATSLQTKITKIEKLQSTCPARLEKEQEGTERDRLRTSLYIMGTFFTVMNGVIGILVYIGVK